jgi:hypothetical protein
MRAIERLDPRATGFAAAALRLGGAIRSVASRRRTVGRGVLTVDIPRSVMDAQRSERVILHSSPDPDQVTFSLLSPGSADGTVHGPTYVGEGAVMANFQDWQPPDNGLA